MTETAINNNDVPELGQALQERTQVEDQVLSSLKTRNDYLRHAVMSGSVQALMEVILGYQYKDIHRDMIRLQHKHDKCLVLAPRGIGKSTILTVVRCIYEVLRNPDIRILIVSNTQLQAEIFLREIKNHLENNELLTEVFGEMVGDKWDNREINVKGRRTFAKESTISCCGVGGAIVGRHYDLIIADDLVDEENSRTELQRERFKVWFYKSLYPCLEPDKGSRFYIHGTRYYPSDHYGHIIDVDHEFQVEVYPAIINGKSIWEEKMSYAWLMERKKALGAAIFESQYMNSTKSMEGKIFRYEYFKHYDVLPPELKIFQGVDLAITQKDTADYFVIVTIGKDEYNRIYIIDVYENRLSFLQQAKAIEEYFNRFKPIRTCIEANAYQQAQAQYLLATTEVRVKPLYTQKDKTTRAWHLSSKFENGLVHFPKFGMERLKEQLISMPNASHFDLFDALDLAITGATKTFRKERREFSLL